MSRWVADTALFLSGCELLRRTQRLGLILLLLAKRMRMLPQIKAACPFGKYSSSFFFGDFRRDELDLIVAKSIGVLDHTRAVQKFTVDIPLALLGCELAHRIFCAFS